MASKTPYLVETYCGACHDTKAHYLTERLNDEKRVAYVCAGCCHVVFVNKREAPNA